MTIPTTQFSLGSAVVWMLATSVLLYFNVSHFNLVVFLIDSAYLEFSLLMILKLLARIDTSNTTATFVSSPLMVFLALLLLLNTAVFLITGLIAVSLGAAWLTAR